MPTPIRECSVRERALRIVSRPALVFITALLFCSFASAQSVTGTIDVGAAPAAAATDPLTNMIYVANKGSNNVTPINGAANPPVAGTAIPVGASPAAIAVNPATNMIYVANNGSNNVTPINGAANPPTAGTPIPVGTNPIAIAVNPATSMIYVANNGSNNVTPING